MRTEQGVAELFRQSSSPRRAFLRSYAASSRISEHGGDVCGLRRADHHGSISAICCVVGYGRRVAVLPIQSPTNARGGAGHLDQSKGISGPRSRSSPSAPHRDMASLAGMYDT